MMEIPKNLLACVEDVLFDRKEDATERLLDLAETLKGQKNDVEVAVLEWRNKSFTRPNHLWVSQRD